MIAISGLGGIVNVFKRPSTEIDVCPDIITCANTTSEQRD